MKIDRTASRPRPAGILAGTLVVALAATLAPAPGSSSAWAAAQTSRPAAETRPREQPAADPAAILAGPRVEASALGERDSRFGARARRGQRPGVPPRRWLVIVRGLDLTSAQRRKVREIVAQLEADRRAFQREDGKEMRELRRAVRRHEEGAGGNQAAPPREMRQRMQELQALAPKVETYQQRVWEALTPAQQDDLRRELVRVRAEMTARRRGGEKDELRRRDR